MTNTITLNNGVAMPALGLGVFQTPPDVTTTVVEQALRLGYRHIDTTAAYANEREVGEGIRRAEVARDDVFIETKVWISDYGYDETLHAFDKSAGKLGSQGAVEGRGQCLMKDEQVELGHLSAASPPTGRPRRAPSTTRRFSRSRASTAKRPPR